MRMALPNAFFFGLTGTPINRVDKNTFATFGAEEDRTGYMSRYSFLTPFVTVLRFLFTLSRFL